MANDLFGGLMKGLSGLMPQDDPDVKLMNAQSELNDLRQQETEIYAEIGRRTAGEEGLSRFGEIADRLKLIQSNIALAEQKLSMAKGAKDAQAMQDAQGVCPKCGKNNPPGVKFCQDCGAKLGKVLCAKCGAELAAGIRFCGECGASQSGG